MDKSVVGRLGIWSVGAPRYRCCVNWSLVQRLGSQDVVLIVVVVDEGDGQWLQKNQPMMVGPLSSPPWKWQGNGWYAWIDRGRVGNGNSPVGAIRPRQGQIHRGEEVQYHQGD